MPPLRKGGERGFPPFHFAEGADGVFFHIDVGSIKLLVLFQWAIPTASIRGASKLKSLHVFLYICNTLI